jgi:hypothetical protein
MSNVELVNDSAELADFRIAQMFTGDAAVALVAALESAPGGGLTDEGAVSHRRPSLLTPRAVPEMCPMRSTSASVQHRDGQPLVAQGPQQPGHPRRRLATTRPAEQGGGDRSTVRVDASRVTTPASVSKGTESTVPRKGAPGEDVVAGGRQPRAGSHQRVDEALRRGHGVDAPVQLGDHGRVVLGEPGGRRNHRGTSDGSRRRRATGGTSTVRVRASRTNRFSEPDAGRGLKGDRHDDR